MANCVSCTSLVPFIEPEGVCRKVRQRIGTVRLGCCEGVVETIAATDNCDIGYIDDLVAEDPVNNATPLFIAKILNKEDADEAIDFSFDRATDTGTLNYNLVLRVKIHNADQDCAFKSMLGQDFCIYYEIENAPGDWAFRRIKGKLITASGGLLAGYDLTFNVLDPTPIDSPLFVNFGDYDTTLAGLDLLTTF